MKLLAILATLSYKEWNSCQSHLTGLLMLTSKRAAVISGRDPHSLQVDGSTDSCGLNNTHLKHSMIRRDWMVNWGVTLWDHCQGQNLESCEMQEGLSGRASVEVREREVFSYLTTVHGWRLPNQEPEVLRWVKVLTSSQQWLKKYAKILIKPTVRWNKTKHDCKLI